MGWNPIPNSSHEETPVQLDQLKFLSVAIDGHVAVVTMDRPPVNAVSGAMYVEIRDFFADFDLNLPGVRVVVLTGRGRHFCAGNDLPEFVEMTPENAPGRMKTVREAFWAIYDCPVPVIAAVNGAALGTGLAITASCDFAVCGLSAQLGCPEVAIGVMGAAKHLSRLLPQPLVRYLYFNAEPMAAADMERFGAVLKVVPDDEVLNEAIAIATKIARHSPAALRTAKESMNTIESMDLKSGYEFEQRLTGQLSGNADAREALLARTEKRDAVFGR